MYSWSGNISFCQIHSTFWFTSRCNTVVSQNVIQELSQLSSPSKISYWPVTLCSVQRRQGTYCVYHNMEARSRNHCCRRKAVSIKYSKCLCILALVIRHVNQIVYAPCYTVFSGLSSSAIFLHITSWRTRISGTVFFNRECVLWFSVPLLSEIFLILRGIPRDKFTYVFMYSVRYSCQILIRLEFSRQIFENSSGRRVVARWWMKGHDEANSSFSQFANGPKKSSLGVSLLQRSDDRVLPMDFRNWTTVYSATFNILITHVKRQRLTLLALLRRIL